MKGPRPAATSYIAIDPRALARGIDEFNSWRFYDCHETLEDVWREEETDLADFYQGIIKVATGFHHLLRGNHKGAVNLLSGGLALLDPFRPRCLGVDIERLIQEVRPCLDRILDLGPRRLSQFDRSQIPRIHFDLPAGRHGPEAVGAA